LSCHFGNGAGHDLTFADTGCPTAACWRSGVVFGQLLDAQGNTFLVGFDVQDLDLDDMSPLL
jgi:hypothetical protein